MIPIIAPPIAAAIFLFLFYEKMLPEEWSNYEDLLIPAIGFLVTYLIVILWLVPKAYVSSLQRTSPGNVQSEFDRRKETLKLEDDTRKTIAQIIGGVVILGGLFFTYNSYRLSIEKQDLDREGQITERFTKAVELLSNQDATARSGALYALERISKDSTKDHWTIMDILSSYVSGRSPNKKLAVEDGEGPDATNGPEAKNKPAKTGQVKNERVKADIEAALVILGRGYHDQDAKGVQMRLSRANLSEAILNGLDFRLTHFVFSDLSGIYLVNSDLSDSNFNAANLTGARLKNAKLDGAIFYNADLTDARYLTFEQMETAIINENTKLPDYLAEHRQKLLDVSPRNNEARTERLEAAR